MRASWWAHGRVAVAVVLAVSLVGTTGCHEDYRGRAGGPRVAVIGDSITDLSSAVLHERLDPDYAVSVSGQGGATIAERQPMAVEYDLSAPDAVVVELGANDAFRAVGSLDAQAPPPESIADSLDASRRDLRLLLSALPHARCIVVVNLGTFVLHRSYGEWAHRWNESVLPVVAAGDPRIRIADWDLLGTTYGHGPEASGPLTMDTIHPTPFGQQMLAAEIRAQLDGCGFARPAPGGGA